MDAYGTNDRSFIADKGTINVFAPQSRPAVRFIQPSIKRLAWAFCFPWKKSGRSVTLITHLNLVTRVLMCHIHIYASLLYVFISHR
jgi:hypothetical protein